MLCQIKTLTLFFLAASATGALFIPTVQGASGTLTSEGKSVIATGDQVGEHAAFTLTDHPFQSTFVGTKCKSVKYTGTEAVSEGATTVRVHPEYKECIFFPFGFTIVTTGCDYVYHFGAATSFGWHVATDIVCSPGSAIRLLIGNCEVTVGPQEGLTTSEVTNVGGLGTSMDLMVHTGITNITYTVVKDPIGCPLSGAGTFHKGDYVGDTTVRAHDLTNAIAGTTVH